MRRRARQALVAGLLATLAAAGGCRTLGPYDGDARIEAEVKARLVAEQAANLTRLSVVSDGGTVYLSGTVTTPDQRSRAETLTRGIRGVHRVVNTLDVEPAGE
jgi:osmotically-inducible protein OsmY